MNNLKKRNLGQFFTKKDIWLLPQIKRFIKKCNCKYVLDPFAGSGDLLVAVSDFNFYDFFGYDIDEKLDWPLNNSLIDIPFIEDTIVITNPPYLSKNSAKRNNMNSYNYFKDNNFLDLYQIAVCNVLEKFNYAVFIIPETFLRSKFFKKYLYSITILEENPFEDTECPICVCCFRKNTIFGNEFYDIFKGKLFLMDNIELKNRINQFNSSLNTKIEFNNIKGNLGLRGVDNTSNKDRIKFCLPKDLNYNESNIKISSRAITLIKVNFEIDEKFVERANDVLEEYRVKTHDVLLAPFKNNNKNGIRRRRLDFNLARKLINKTIEVLDK